MPPRSTARAVPYLLLAALAGCSSTSGGGGSGGSGPGTGGVTGTGGATGGTVGTGGAGTGGSATGGSGAGGLATGGSGTGGSATGGAAGSVAATGGAAGGQTGKGGQGGSAGASGSGGSGGASSACPYKLCEDFESGTSGGIPDGWTMLKGYGSSTGVGLATDAAHGGSMSLKSNSSTTGQGRVQKSLSALGATATKHWGRIFYKVQPVKPSSGVLHITFTALENPGTNTSATSIFENRVVDTVEDSNGKHQWIYNVPDDSCCTGSDYNWSFDTSWHCAEWYADQSTQSYRFFTDGTEVTQIGFTNNSNAKMMAWQSIAVGAIFYQTPPSAVVVWFDDLAIDDKQIGCK